MTRAVLWVVPAVAVVAALLAGGGAMAAVGAGLVGVVAAMGLWSLEVGRVRRFARRVNRWAGDDSNVVLSPTGGSQWRELGTAVNALGTQLREAREELRSLVPWAQRLVASLDEPAFVFGADGRLAAANDNGLLLANLPTMGEGAPTVMSTLGSAAVADAVVEARESGHLIAVTEQRGGRDLRITASPLDHDVLVVVSDRTRERRIEELRRDFVINASHELKTPVTAIQALVDALAVAPADRRYQLQSRLAEESERLSRLVHDLLDLRLLEEDTDRELVSVDLGRVVRASVADATPAAEERGITFDLDLPDSAVVVGIESPDWAILRRSRSDGSRRSSFEATGSHGAIASGRLSFALGLHGACLSVNTACSTGLVALDVAARGIDVQDVTHVFHFNLPNDNAYYTHRSGRTARAGKKGVSIAFISRREKAIIGRMENALGIDFTPISIPDAKAINTTRIAGICRDGDRKHIYTKTIHKLHCFFFPLLLIYAYDMRIFLKRFRKIRDELA